MGELRILYVGQLWEGGTCQQRFEALQELGHEVDGINTDAHCVSGGPHKRRALLSRLYGALLRGMGVVPPYPWGGDANGEIEAHQALKRWDLLWIDKGLGISATTLQRFKVAQPSCTIVGYSPDDMANIQNQSRQFLEHLPLYDYFFTTKSYGVKDLVSLGCRRAIFVDNAYSLRVHRCIDVSANDQERLGGPVGFIGAYERQRARSICALARAGVTVRVWGEGWGRSVYRHQKMRRENKPLWGDAYARAICSFKINLCFLRKVNRDLQTTRSIEIPACGGFMLGERTSEHSRLFSEGQEAEYFSSDEELIRKVKLYLANDEARRTIAERGWRRCVASGYSNVERLRWMLETIARDTELNA